MTSLPDKFTKVSGPSCSKEIASKYDVYSTSKTDSLTTSSPPIMEPSKDEACTESYRRRPIVVNIYTRPLLSNPSETVPIVSDDQANERVAEQQINEQVEGSENDYPIMNCYKKFAIKIRNSAFIHILQLLFSSIPVSSVVMGVLFAENCPKVHFLPVFGAVVGVIGAIVMAVWMFVSCSHRRGTPCSNRQIFLFGMMCFVAMVMTIVDAVFVISLSPSFDSMSTEYCNETFYNYAFYKEIATAVVMVLLAMIYLPGSRHILCCHDCSMRSTPNAFYVSI